MPRRSRVVVTGLPFHVTNRVVERRRLFRRAADYRLFLHLLAKGKERHPVSVFGICLMPNHFHAVVRADQDRALSAYFHWVQGCYSRMLRIKTHTSGDGHVFQQRFWTGAIQDDWHFLNVLKYVERNPVAAELVPRAEQWPWSSLVMREKEAPILIDPPPVRLPADWIGYVNADPCPEEAD